MSKVERFQGIAHVEVMSSKDAAIADVSFELLDKDAGSIGRYHWSGTSKRFNGEHDAEADAPDHEVGVKLALARALRSASRQLERQAMGQLKCNEDNRRASVEARKRRRAQKATERRNGAGKRRTGTRRVPVAGRAQTRTAPVLVERSAD